MKRILIDILAAGAMTAFVLLIHGWMEFRDWHPECQVTPKPYRMTLVIADSKTILRRE